MLSNLKVKAGLSYSRPGWADLGWADLSWVLSCICRELAGGGGWHHLAGMTLFSQQVGQGFVLMVAEKGPKGQGLSRPRLGGGTHHLCYIVGQSKS